MLSRRRRPVEPPAPLKARGCVRSPPPSSRRRYLAKIKVAAAANQPASACYMWGPRAFVEFTEADTLEFLAEVPRPSLRVRRRMPVPSL